MKAFKILLGLVILFSIVSGIYFWRVKQSYELISPKTGPILESVYGLGKVKSNQRYEVKLGVIATITALHVHEGDFVEAKQALIEFDNSSAFRAPFDGVITFISAFVQETVPPQVPVLRLEDLKDRYIEVSLEQQAALRVRPGQNVKVVFESIRNHVLQGKVDAIFPRNDEFLAHIGLSGLEDNVLPGMTADVSIEIGKIDNALLIPVTAVSNGLVTIERSGKKEKIKVEVGHVDGMWAEIKDSNIHLDDKIIVPRTKP